MRAHLEGFISKLNWQDPISRYGKTVSGRRHAYICRWRSLGEAVKQSNQNFKSREVISEGKVKRESRAMA